MEMALRAAMLSILDSRSLPPQNPRIRLIPTVERNQAMEGGEAQAVTKGSRRR